MVFYVPPAIMKEIEQKSRVQANVPTETVTTPRDVNMDIDSSEVQEK